MQNLVLINNVAHQRETVSERPIRLSLRTSGVKGGICKALLEKDRTWMYLSGPGVKYGNSALFLFMEARMGLLPVYIINLLVKEPKRGANVAIFCILVPFNQLNSMEQFISF